MKEPRTVTSASRWQGARAWLVRLHWPMIAGIGVFLLLSYLAIDAAGARSGGSGGGSSFGGGGGGGGGGDGCGGIIFYLIIDLLFLLPVEILVPLILVAVVLTVLVAAKRRAALESRVYRLRFAIEMPGDKPWVELEQLVSGRNMTTGEGLAALCREAALYLSRRSESITHAAIKSEPGKLAPAVAHSRFLELTHSTRSYFDREVLRIDAGGVTRKTRESANKDELHDEDGDFGINEFFLVTIIVAVRAALEPLPTPLATPADVSKALTFLSGLTGQDVKACEVVWTPAAQSDILTSDNLLESFPELAPLV